MTRFWWHLTLTFDFEIYFSISTRQPVWEQTLQGRVHISQTWGCRVNPQCMQQMPRERNCWNRADWCSPEQQFEHDMPSTIRISLCMRLCMLLCFSNYMLDISGGFHEMGGVRWQLVLCLLLCWVIVFFSLAKGITVSGKVPVVCVIFKTRDMTIVSEASIIIL